MVEYLLVVGVSDFMVFERRHVGEIEVGVELVNGDGGGAGI
jgi:hypothetical protein